MPSIIIDNIPEGLVYILRNAFPESGVKWAKPCPIGELQRGHFTLPEQTNLPISIQFQYMNMGDEINIYNETQINAIKKAAVFIQPSIEKVCNTFFLNNAQEIFLHQHVLYPGPTATSGHWHQDYYMENGPSSVTAIFYYQETNSQATLCFKKHNDNDNNILYSIDTTAKPIVVTFNNLALDHAVQGVVKRDSSMPAWRCLFTILYIGPYVTNRAHHIKKLQATSDFSIDDQRTGIDSPINDNVDETTSINQLTTQKFSLFETTDASVNSPLKKRMPTEENEDESVNEKELNTNIKKGKCG